MSSLYDNNSDDELPPLPPALPPRYRESSIQSTSYASASGSGSGSRSFLNRLQNSTDRDNDDGMTGLGVEPEDEVDESDMDDVRRMGKVWVRERGVSGILPWEGDLVDSLFDKIEQQQKLVNTLRSDPQTSEEEHFKLMLVMTEMERVKYLIRSYLRTRLSKIERYSQYIVLNPGLHTLLSGAELQHAQRYTELVHTHFQHSVLDSLPEWLQRMDETYNDGLSMVSKPDRNIPVLVYCKRDCGEITLEGGESATLAKGTTHLVKFRLVERWINLGWVEVL